MVVAPAAKADLSKPRRPIFIVIASPSALSRLEGSFRRTVAVSKAPAAQIGFTVLSPRLGDFHRFPPFPPDKAILRKLRNQPETNCRITL
jgi:hypothetical protein